MNKSLFKKIGVGISIIISAMTINNCFAMNLCSYFRDDIVYPPSSTSHKYKHDTSFDELHYSNIAKKYFGDIEKKDSKFIKSILTTLQNFEEELIGNGFSALQFKKVKKEDLETTLENLKDLWTNITPQETNKIEWTELKDRVANLHDYLIYEINLAADPASRFIKTNKPPLIKPEYLQNRDDQFFTDMYKYIRGSGPNPSKHIQTEKDGSNSDSDSD